MTLHGFRSRWFVLATLMVTAIATLGTPSIVAGELAWRELPEMPVGKWEAATALIEGKLFLFGGYARGVRSSRSAPRTPWRALTS